MQEKHISQPTKPNKHNPTAHLPRFKPQARHNKEDYLPSILHFEL
jgi:hypothetical protein